jgi:hypothetical protein
MKKSIFVLFSVVTGVFSLSAVAAPTIPESAFVSANSAIAFESEAAVAYHRVLTGDVLPENYTIRHYSYVFPNSDDFQLLLSSFRDFKGFVGAKVLDICLKQARSRKRCEAAAGNLLNAYVEVLEGPVAAITFASWLYRLDGDNWFDYDAAHKVTVPYVASDERKLFLVKGWRPDKVLVSKLTERDLPVVIDLKEKTFTIWTSELDD